MPPRARFGRYPRSAPNLQNTIIAIAREMEAQQDRLIMDAWQNGGVFEGKKVTDQMALKHWKDKMKGLDKSDPLYETYKNQTMQLQYGIEQSKADLAHVQGKLSDAGYANFFLKWAGKVPKNSEFWRTLQKDAAQMIERSKASGRASAEKAKRDSFNNFVTSTTRESVAVGDALTAALTSISKETGMSITGNGEQLLSILTNDVANHPEKYHALLTAIKADDPRWDGKITQGYFSAHIEEATNGYDRIANRAYKEGYASVYSGAVANQTEMAKWGQNIDVWPVSKSYDVAYKAYERVMSDPSAGIVDRDKAREAFSATAAQLAGTPGIDEGTKAMLIADSQRVLGNDAGDAPSFGEYMLGHTGVTPQAQAQAAYDAQQNALMQHNPGQYVYASADAKGQFDPSGQGGLGIVPASSVPPNAVFIPTSTLSGKGVMVAVQPHSIMAQDPNDPNADKVEIGKVITTTLGGRTTTLYGYIDDNGKAAWSSTSPLAEGTTVAYDKDGNMQVTLPGSVSADPMSKAASIDAKYGTHLVDQIKQGSLNPSAVQYTRDEKTNKVTGRINVSVKNGTEFTVTNTEMIYDAQSGSMLEGATTPVRLTTSPQDIQKGAFAPSRMSAGDLPGITFNSPVAAAVSDSRNTLTGDQIGALSQDPLFQSAFLTQTMQNLGTQNPLDPRIKAAWDQVTRPALPYDPVDRTSAIRSVRAADRKDLTYPSAVDTNPASQATLSITFGGQTLKVPNAPNYLQGAQVDAGIAGDFLGALMQGTQKLNGGQLPASYLPGAAVTGTGVTPTPTPTVTPTPATTPVSATPLPPPPKVTPVTPPTTKAPTPPPPTPTSTRRQVL